MMHTFVDVNELGGVMGHYALCPTYRKPFDLFAQGSETGKWLLGLDSNTALST